VVGRLMLIALALGGIVATPPAAHAQPFVTYECRDGTELVAYFAPGSRTAHLKLDGRSMTLSRRISVSGRQYTGSGITFRANGHTATLNRGRQSTQCTAN
jgi:membrane-bound inhibitor of C-type lysozyme